MTSVEPASDSRISKDRVRQVSGLDLSSHDGAEKSLSSGKQRALLDLGLRYEPEKAIERVLSEKREAEESPEPSIPHPSIQSQNWPQAGRFGADGRFVPDPYSQGHPADVWGRRMDQPRR